MDAVGEGFLAFSLSVEVLFLGLQELAVVSLDPQEAVLVEMVELHDLGGHVFEKIAIVADHHAGEGRVLQNAFQPLDPGEVQMVGGFVEEKNVGLLDQARANRQAFAPAAR